MLCGLVHTCLKLKISYKISLFHDQPVCKICKYKSSAGGGSISDHKSDELTKRKNVLSKFELYIGRDPTVNGAVTSFST